MILILSSSDDVHAEKVARTLKQRGAMFAWIEHGSFPSAASISTWLLPAGEAARVYRHGDEQIDLESVSAAWYRRPGSPQPETAIGDTRAGKYVLEEGKACLQDLWNSLDCLWVPAPFSVFRRAEMKISQLRAASRVGLEIPPTLVTNEPKNLVDFYRAHDGKIISKMPSNAFARDVFAGEFVRYTEPVSRRDLASAQAVRHSPMLFQAYVPKRVELRITVVGERVFAAEIHSQSTEHTRYDWRRYDLDHTPHLVHLLPQAIERSCLALVQELELRYGAIDMILTPDGRYVFIEINPNGQYLWIEDLTGLPISEAICDLLMEANPAKARARPAIHHGSNWR